MHSGIPFNLIATAVVLTGLVGGCASPNLQFASESFQKQEAARRDLKEAHINLTEIYTASASSVLKNIQKVGCRPAFFDTFEKETTEFANAGMRESQMAVDLSQNAGSLAADDVNMLTTLGAEKLRTIFQTRLTVADSALAKGCLDGADSQYRAVLRSSSPEYESYRRRAEIGIADVREKRATRSR